MSESAGSPTFRCSIERNGTEATLLAQGEIDLASSPELRRELHSLLDDGVNRITLDLDAVSFIDSSGLGVLVGVLKRIEETPDDGCGLELRNLKGPVLKVFEITGLQQVFVVAD